MSLSDQQEGFGKLSAVQDAIKQSKLAIVSHQWNIFLYLRFYIFHIIKKEKPIVHAWVVDIL